MNTNNMNQLFENQKNWDFEEPTEGHQKRFQDKLRKQKPKKKKFSWLPLSIAASLLLAFGLFYFNYDSQQNVEVVFSPQVQETHDYFSSVIKTELEALKKQETPESKALITDALTQMDALESDYENLKLEIAKNGENKQIIYAMITNMQTRISFVKSVLDQVETIKKIKNDTHENQL
jgi:hypothetical protein